MWRGAVAGVAAAVVLTLAGCGGNGGDDSAESPPSKTPSPRTETPRTETPRTETPGTETPSTRPPRTETPPADDRMPATDLPPDMSDRTQQDMLALKTLELQVALREIDSSLGSAEDVDKAGKQCAELSRGSSDAGAAARRFSTPGHRLTEADGKRINTMLSERFCP
ncbi:hypothetical protein DVA86_13090 [Streptomyces armeniacus]|uniref:DUF732 domain-containing protein n=1 Tax=Streptomyces armeniacus TaxID=83291 RepID=A0A345XP81_9ACTN|nr:hypothetical protein DVA86_13090 [Streptomyces armeniacus]